jgi:hypothetical protein
MAGRQVVAGTWFDNPLKGALRKRKKRSKKRKRNLGTLSILRNPKGGSVARKRRKSVHRRKTRRRKNITSTLYAANPKRRRRSRRRKAVYHRRRKSYASSHRRRSNPVRRRRRSYRRRRNPSSLVSKASRASRSLLSFGMVKKVAAGAAGFAGVNVLEPFIPYSPSTVIGLYVKKAIAAVGTYMIGGMVLSNPSQKKYLLYGAAMNIGLELIKSQAPGLASKAKLNGLRGYDQLTQSNLPERVTSYMATPTIGN